MCRYRTFASSVTVRLMSDREALISLARSVADAAPSSMDEVAEVEEQLLSLDRDLPGWQDFETAIAMYRPGGGDQLLNEPQMQQAARFLLHELGDHERCLHDVPLIERP